MKSVPCHPLESGAPTEPEYLRVVKWFLGERISQVEPQWAKRRIPDQAHADRRPDAAVAARRQCFIGHIPGGRPDVIQQLTRVGKYRKFHPEIFWRKEQRRLKFYSGCPVERAAKGVGLAEAERYLREVSRSKPCRRESPDQVRPTLEVIEHAQTFATPSRGIATLGTQQTDDVREDFIVQSRIHRRFDKPYVAASTSPVLLEFDEQTVRWVLVVIERIVGERVAEGRHENRSLCQFPAHRQRGFAILEAVHWRAKCSLSVRSRKRIDVIRISVVTVIQLGRQRDLLPIGRIPHLGRYVVCDRNAQLDVAADRFRQIG